MNEETPTPVTMKDRLIDEHRTGAHTGLSIPECEHCAPMSTADRYRTAWQDWQEAPHDMGPAWTADRTTLARTDRAAGKADSGPRRAHGHDDTVHLVHAVRAEATDGLALSIALAAGTGALNMDKARRAHRSIDRIDSGYASTVRLMGADTTAAIDGLAGAYRWHPECIDMTDAAHPVPFSNGEAIIVENGGRAAGQWRRYARRHGYATDARADLRPDLTDNGSCAIVRRARKHLAEALRRIEANEFPTDAPGRGRPAGWIAAVRWLQVTGRTDFTGPDWLAERAAPTDDREPQWSLAWDV